MPTIASAQDNRCPADLRGGSISCVGGDVSVATLNYDPADLPATCVAGETIEVAIELGFEVNANARRDDIAVWVAESPGDVSEPFGSGGPTGCDLLVLGGPINSSINPFPLVVDDLDGDVCDDVLGGSQGEAFFEDFAPETVEVTCLPDQNGQLAFQTVVTWDEGNGRNFCDGTPTSFEDSISNAKCRVDEPLVLPIEVLASLTIEKQTEPDGSLQPFSYSGTVDGSPFAGFELTDGQSNTITGALGDQFIVNETIASGWFVESIVCTDNQTQQQATATVDPSTGQVDITLDESQYDVTCVYTNVEYPTITVTKNTVGGNGLFAVNWAGPTTSGGIDLDTGVINTDTETIVTTETGTFTLTELIPAGWALGNAACVDDNGGASIGTWDNVDTINGIDLSPGQSVTCTFTNQAIGTVMLIKNTVGGDGSFDFVTDVPGLGTNIQTTGGSGSTSASNVPAGTYSIVEFVPAGWVLDSATCDDGSPPDALALTLNETVTCTFVNIKLGTVIVEKQTLPDGDPQFFDFTLNPGNASQAIADGGQIVVPDLTAGVYTATETIPAGWDLANIVCDDGNSTGDTESGIATFNLEAGEIVTCVFTNTKGGSIEVVKSLSATGPSDETFSFTSNFNGTFDLVGDAATTGPIAVAPGSGYTVSEDDPTANGWANVGASCGDGSDPLTNIDVAPGEAVVCAFTNTPLGTAVVIKNTVGANDVFGFTGDDPIGPFSLNTADLFTASTGDLYEFILTAGIYDITEDNIPAGWALTGIGCDNGSLTDLETATASLDVDLAETVACTFTNTADGTLIIRKETIPDGAEQGFDFTGEAEGTIQDYSTTGQQIVASGQPGIYTSAESVPPGWTITDISCSGGVQSGVTIGASDVSVDLAAGETVICTFENTLQGGITIDKLTWGGVGSFQFNGTLGPFPLDTTGANPDSANFTNLLPGTYMISEVVPADWTLSSIACSGAVNSTVTIGSEGGFDPGDQSVIIDLVDGESITCAFVNDANGSISVTKATDPPGSAQSFDFTGAITASLTDGQTSTPLSVPPGNYAVTESAVAGWGVTDISCSDDDSTGTGSTANFVVAPGEIVNCTFTNTIQRGNIVVEKQTDPDDSSQLFDFTTSYSSGFSLSDGQRNDSGPLLPTSEAGTYSVSESLPAGWELTSATCSDGSPADAIDLAVGEVVTCTFENAKLGEITIEKIVVGNDASFDFQTSYAPGSFTLSNGQSNASGYLTSGTYTITETATDGYALTEVACSGDVNSTVAIGDTGVEIGLVEGEEINCTFTNSATERIAEFRVYKQFMDGNDITPVTLKIQCNSGMYSPSEVTLIPPEINGPGDFAMNFIISKFTEGMDCTVWEEPIAGYTPSYACDVFSGEGVITQCSDGDDSPLDDFGTGPCIFTDVATTGISPIRHSCTIRNYPDPVDVDVTKIWETFGAEQADVDPDVRITLYCEDAIEIVGGTYIDGLWSKREWLREEDGDFDDEDDNYVGVGTVTFEVVPEWIAIETDPDEDQEYETECWAEENISNNAVEVVSDCGTSDEPGIGVRVGEGDECTMTNTVFFEGIPTLSQYGMVIMALLMLGVGFIGLRRLV